MEIEQQNLILENLPADRDWIQRLYEQGKLSQKARNYALGLVCPPLQWGQWIADILLKLGFAFILASIVYFFAFNRVALPSASIFIQIEIGLLVALCAVYYFGLQGLAGQLALLSASVLVGVFLSILEQQYQTGLNAYALFMWWSILIFTWTAMSCSAVQWLLWIVITNIAIILWQMQFAIRIDDINPLLMLFLGLFNLGMIALREYGLHIKKYTWLQKKWTALLLLAAILIIYVFSIGTYISEDEATQGLMWTAIFNLAGLIGFFIYYRHINLDIFFLASVVISLGVLMELILIEIVFSGISVGIISFIIGSMYVKFLLMLAMVILTLSLCVFLVKYLRHVAKIRQV